MEIKIFDNARQAGKAAGAYAAYLIHKAIEINNATNIILATGTSQFETLNQLASEKNVDWEKVLMFHLDEYIGLSITHPASFRKYLQERFLSKLPPLKATYFVNGEADPIAECKRLGDLITHHPIDVALVGIGENGHLAFNDPPADFATEQPYIIVELDAQCRKQQVNEGWFTSMEEVPARAISMSVNQILKSKHIICSVPDARKANAVKNSIQQQVSNLYPATILQLHPHCTFYLDKFSSALLPSDVIGQKTIYHND
ncbi:MAG: glucosamine-6-phosphate deaminase [Chitinophagales bacterium]